jgi:hypothetical protein
MGWLVPPPKTLHTSPLTPEQAAKLRAVLLERGWQFEPRQ